MMSVLSILRGERGAEFEGASESCRRGLLPLLSSEEGYHRDSGAPRRKIPPDYYRKELPGGQDGFCSSSMSGQTKCYGWFSGFFPQTDPEYVIISSFWKNGGGGGACLRYAGGLDPLLERRSGNRGG